MVELMLPCNGLQTPVAVPSQIEHVSAPLHLSAIIIDMSPSPLVQPAVLEPLLRHCGSVTLAASAGASLGQLPQLAWAVCPSPVSATMSGSALAPHSAPGANSALAQHPALAQPLVPNNMLAPYPASERQPRPALAPPPVPCVALVPQPARHPALAPQPVPAPGPLQVPLSVARLPPLGVTRVQQPSRYHVLVDASATTSGWGVGACIVVDGFVRRPDDGLGRFDWSGGGPKSEFFEELRRLSPTDDTDATAEAVALMAGVLLSWEFCQEQDLKEAVPIVTDRPANLSNLGNRGHAGPVLTAALEIVARHVLCLAQHYGPVVFLNKHRISAMDNTHDWLPDRLAARGRTTGTMTCVHQHPLAANWRESFHMAFDGPAGNVRSLTFIAKVTGGPVFLSELPRGPV